MAKKTEQERTWWLGVGAVRGINNPLCYDFWPPRYGKEFEGSWEYRPNGHALTRTELIALGIRNPRAGKLYCMTKPPEWEEVT